jgi:hypothetical protein
VTPGDELRDRGLATLDDQLDAAVGSVPHPPAKIELARPVFDRGSEENPLHVALDEHSNAPLSHEPDPLRLPYWRSGADQSAKLLLAEDRDSELLGLLELGAGALAGDDVIDALGDRGGGAASGALD